MSNSSPPDDSTKMRAPEPTAATRLHAASASQTPDEQDAGTRHRPQADSTLYRHNAAPPDGTQLRDLTAARPHQRSQSREFAPGDVIKERFQLTAQIGRGGMGVVFAAIDRRKEEMHDPNPYVALKILNADFEQHPDALMSLQREAHKSQSLAHPNVVTVFDFDRDGDRVYMTMELLRGRSLEAVMREARGHGIGREAAVPVIRGIAEGLAYAHRKGIVHSDLKPGNVFLLEDGTPKILDFGIARAVPSAATEQDTFDAGVLGGYTEGYATAEMVAGTDPHPADDMYALGLIAYELLTGVHPYQRQGAVKARELGLKYQAPKGLKRHEWKALESCLALDRARRPRDAGEFLKRFFGVTKLQKSLVAATVILTLAAAFLAYRNYQDSSPAVAFGALPVETQNQFNTLMAGGDKEWQFYQKEHNLMALWNSLDQYSDAYKLHPHNRTAVRALERSADAFLDATAGKPEEQKQAAEKLSQMSESLAKSPPLMRTAGE